MIRATHIIRVRSNSRGTKRENFVRVVISGDKDMRAFADSCAAAGMEENRVARIRIARRATVNLTPEQAKSLGIL